ncbi:hypothetical protein [Chenggangzhangella methanolivorans]|nr:hypothetical protein [Chenggangzhangella methanolivorans]
MISPQVINEFTSVLTRKLKLYTIPKWNRWSSSCGDGVPRH